MVDLKAAPFYLEDETISKIRQTVADMTLEEKAEQVICPLSYTTDVNALSEMFQKHTFGGIMFRAGNAKETQAAIQAVQKASKLPVLVAANLEDGGNGIAADRGTYVGRQMLIAATDDESKAYDLGRICGIEGRAVGVNWAFAPVVDIDFNFRNPITNVRTYGSDPKRVLRMSSAYQKGAMETGVLTAIKHFPGDGVDERDQHLLTSVNSLSLEEWEESYGKIYRTLIQEGAKAVMVGHIAMPAMEEKYEGKKPDELIPASLSKNIVSHYLREELGFQGLISTDASPMVGFASAMERRIAVPTAIANGCDMLLFQRDLEEDLEFMLEGVRSGILTEERLDEAVTRILGTKATMNWDVPAEDELAVLGNERHISIAKECADRGITLVKDKQGLLPLSPKKTPRILLEIIGSFPFNERVYGHFEELLKKEGFQITKYIPETYETIFQDLKVEEFKKKYDLVMYIGNIENASNQTVARISWHTLFGAENNLPWFTKEIPALFVSVGNPYHLFDVPMIQTFVNSYCHSPYVIDAVVEKLMGRSGFYGISPVDPFCGMDYLK